MDVVTVIIPVYNRHDTIRNALNSVYAQYWNPADLEVIISDDNSDEPFDYLLKEYPSSLRIVRSEINRGAGVARQRALDVATGKWVTFLDADDVLEERFLDLIAEARKEYNIIRTHVKLVKQNRESWTMKSFDTGFIHGTIFKRSFLKINNLRFDEKLRICEDRYFQMITTEYAPRDTVWYVDQVGYVMRCNNNSTTYGLGLEWYAIMFQQVYGDIQYWIKCDHLLEKESKYTKVTVCFLHLLTQFKDDILDPNLVYSLFDYMKVYLQADTWGKMEHILSTGNRLPEFMEQIKNLYERYCNRGKYELSVIVTLHNSHKHIKKTIDNLYKQLGDHIEYTEVILTDDCSDNPDYNYLLNGHKNIKILNNDVNVGSGLNRNRGLDVADGKWVTFIDHDDEALSKDAFDDFFSIPNKSRLYNMIWGQVEIEYVVGKSKYEKVFTMLHGKFYKKSFLDSSRIRFIPQLKTADDFYFSMRTIFSILEKRKGAKTILYRDMPYYKWNCVEDSIVHSSYNNRIFIEEFLRDHVCSCMLALLGDSYSERLWRAILLYVVIYASKHIYDFKHESQNFKKDNMIYLCGILYALMNKFKVTRLNIDDFFEENAPYMDEIFFNYHAYPMSRYGYNAETINFAYRMLDAMTKEQRDNMVKMFSDMGIDIESESMYPRTIYTR